jgi:hypothetical protein
VLGPLATVGLVAFGWGFARRSPFALGIGLAAHFLETNWDACQRFKRDPRTSGLNLLMAWPDDPES